MDDDTSTTPKADWRPVAVAAVMTLGVLCVAVTGAYKALDPDRELRALVALPFKASAAPVNSDEQAVQLLRETYSYGSYTITELGNVRLIRAFRDGGSSRGTVTVWSTDDVSGNGGSTGTGERGFSHGTVGGGVTECNWGGRTFTVKDYVVRVGGLELDVRKEKANVLLSKEGAKLLEFPAPE